MSEFDYFDIWKLPIATNFTNFCKVINTKIKLRCKENTCLFLSVSMKVDKCLSKMGDKNA